MVKCGGKQLPPTKRELREFEKAEKQEKRALESTRWKQANIRSPTTWNVKKTSRKTRSVRNSPVDMVSPMTKTPRKTPRRAALPSASIRHSALSPLRVSISRSSEGIRDLFQTLGSQHDIAGPSSGHEGDVFRSSTGDFSSLRAKHPGDSLRFSRLPSPLTRHNKEDPLSPTLDITIRLNRRMSGNRPDVNTALAGCLPGSSTDGRGQTRPRANVTSPQPMLLQPKSHASYNAFGALAHLIESASQDSTSSIAESSLDASGSSTNIAPLGVSVPLGSPMLLRSSGPPGPLDTSPSLSDDFPSVHKPHDGIPEDMPACPAIEHDGALFMQSSVATSNTPIDSPPHTHALDSGHPSGQVLARDSEVTSMQASDASPELIESESMPIERSNRAIKDLFSSTRPNVIYVPVDDDSDGNDLDPLCSPSRVTSESTQAIDIPEASTASHPSESPMSAALLLADMASRSSSSVFLKPLYSFGEMMAASISASSVAGAIPGDVNNLPISQPSLSKQSRSPSTVGTEQQPFMRSSIDQPSVLSSRPATKSRVVFGLFDPNDRCAFALQRMNDAGVELPQGPSDDVEMQAVYEDGCISKRWPDWSVRRAMRSMAELMATIFLSPWRFLVGLFVGH